MARWFRRGGASQDASSPSPAPTRGGSPSLSSLPSSANGRSRTGGPAAAAASNGSATPEEQRFAQVYAADRVGPMPYPNQATPDVGAARGRVRQLVGDLVPNAVDEGTGAALDPLIASWTSGWLARTDSQHADHQAVIDRLVGGARQQLAEAEAAHERDRRALEIARRDYTQAREALLEPVEPPPAPSAPEGSDGPRARSWRRRAPTAGGATAPGSAPTEPAERAYPGAASPEPADQGPEDQGPPEPATGPMPVHRPTDAGRTP